MTSLYKNNVVSSPGHLSGCLSSLFITVFYHFIKEKSQSCWSALSQVSPTLLKRKKILVVAFYVLLSLPCNQSRVHFSSLETLGAEFWLLWQGNASVPRCRRRNSSISFTVTTIYDKSGTNIIFFFNFANRIVGILAENSLFLPQYCRRGDVLAGSCRLMPGNEMEHGTAFSLAEEPKKRASWIIYCD